MPGRRQCKYESLTIRQAQHKNSAEQAQLAVVRKFLEQEKNRRADDIERERKKIQESIHDITATAPVPGALLEQYHDLHQRKIQDVCVHIVHCYMQKQDRKKQALHKGHKMAGKTRPTSPGGAAPPRLVTTPDHLMFVQNAFPETYNYAVGYDWTGQRASKVDIYTHGRASHDLKCMSTRATPVGNYGNRGPVNFRLWHKLPGTKSLDPEEPRSKRWRRGSRTLPPRTGREPNGNNVVEVPAVGLARVSPDGVRVYPNNNTADELLSSIPK